MNFFTIITARSSSKRLKNKIMLNITKELRTIDILVKRSKLIGLPIILATSNSKSDDKLVKYVKKKYKINIFRGSLNNKIKRWYNCFLKYKIDAACFIDGDDLLFDFNLYKKNINYMRYISKPLMMKNPLNIVTGAFTYIINDKFLEKIYTKSKNVKNVDVIDNYYKNIRNVKKIKLSNILKSKKVRLTLDYNDDYIFFKKVFAKIKFDLATKNIVKFLISEKKLININFYLNILWKKNQLKEIKKNNGLEI